MASYTFDITGRSNGNIGTTTRGIFTAVDLPTTAAFNVHATVSWCAVDILRVVVVDRRVGHTGLEVSASNSAGGLNKGRCQDESQEK